MKITLVQMNSQDRMDLNLEVADHLIKAAVVNDDADIVVLPEYFAHLDDNPAKMRQSGEAFERHCDWLSETAKKYGVFIHAGSMVEPKDDRSYNTTVVFDREGVEVARYRKMHLFDIDSPNGTQHRESASVAPGRDVVTYKVGDLTVGCAICYDLRFPELFRKLRDLGADLIVLPAAFTLATGKDHWEILVRARAIETQTYFVAAGQVQSFAEGRRTSWGHSMVVDPWGHIVAQASEGVGTIAARIDPAYVTKVRTAIPIADHHVLA